MEKLIMKFIRNCKGPQILITILKAGALTLPVFKTNQKVTLMKSVVLT